jgi:hypothetical protein
MKNHDTDFALLAMTCVNTHPLGCGIAGSITLRRLEPSTIARHRLDPSRDDHLHQDRTVAPPSCSLFQQAQPPAPVMGSVCGQHRPDIGFERLARVGRTVSQRSG